jgi:hypothetical protein
MERKRMLLGIRLMGREVSSRIVTNKRRIPAKVTQDGHLQNIDAYSILYTIYNFFYMSRNSKLDGSTSSSINITERKECKSGVNT